MRQVVAALLGRREAVGDVRRRIEHAGITGSFFLCTTPRTGSTMLADVLAASGVVGKAGEYFNPHVLPHRVRIGDYLVECTDSAHGTGVFGTKLHWDQHEPFLRSLRPLRGADGLTDRALVEAAFPDPRFIWLTRENVVAQAVSWWRAKTTRVFHDHDEPLAEPEFDFNGIQERERLINEQNAHWERWFAENTIDPLLVGYDELVADPVRIVQRALAFLDVAMAEDFVAIPRTLRQADALNEDWIRRYRELARC